MSIAFRLRRDRHGTTALEFALVAPAFLLLLLGSVEYGRLAWTRQALQSVAVLGARCMAVLDGGCASAGSYSSTATQSYLISQAAALGITLTATDVTFSRAANCASLGGFSSVAISYTFNTVLPKLLPTLSPSPTLSASSCFPNTH